MIKAAENKIKQMEGDYSDWVAKSIDQLTEAHRKAGEDLEKAPVYLKTVNRIAHELRGQGGIFGYPLMTQFGKSLYDVTGKDAKVTSQLLEPVEAHIDLIEIVIKQKIKGDGGSVGKQMMQSLIEAKEKFVA